LPAPIWRRRIVACNLVIASGRLQPSDLSRAYNNRGNAYYFVKKEYDRAIADYSEAIQLDPKNVVAYNNGGDAYYYVKRDYDQAITDYDKAIQLDPKYARAYYNRGNAYSPRRTTSARHR
jgi:tetratricopeptide (TPR) repeat protein